MCTGIDRFSKARWESALEPASDPPYLCKETATRTNFVLGFGSQTNHDLPGHDGGRGSRRVRFAPTTSSDNVASQRPWTAPSIPVSHRLAASQPITMEQDPGKILTQANRHMPAALGYGRKHELYYPYIAPRFHGGHGMRSVQDAAAANINEIVAQAESNPYTNSTRGVPPPNIRVNVDRVRVALSQRSETAPFDPCELPPSLSVRDALTLLGGRAGRLPSRVQYTQDADKAEASPVSRYEPSRSIALPRTACGYPKSRVELLHAYAKFQKSDKPGEVTANAHESSLSTYLPRELRGDIDMMANDVRVTSTGKVIITPIPPELRERKSKRDSTLGSTRLW